MAIETSLLCGVCTRCATSFQRFPPNNRLSVYRRPQAQLSLEYMRISLANMGGGRAQGLFNSPRCLNLRVLNLGMRSFEAALGGRDSGRAHHQAQMPKWLSTCGSLAVGFRFFFEHVCSNGAQGLGVQACGQQLRHVRVPSCDWTAHMNHRSNKTKAATKRLINTGP